MLVEASLCRVQDLASIFSHKLHFLLAANILLAVNTGATKMLLKPRILLQSKSVLKLPVQLLHISYSCCVFQSSYELQTKFRKQLHENTFLQSRTIYLNSYHGQSKQKKAQSDLNVTNSKTITINNKEYQSDEWTNATPHILNFIGRNLHLQKHHPLCILKEAIANHFYSAYRRARGPIFAVFDNLSPAVTVEQNFDSLLTPKDHVSRQKSDNYYLNQSNLLRAHTSAHEHDLIKSGLDAYLLVGDVYRRDTIDSTHFPVFHQLEGVRLYNRSQLFSASDDSETYEVFEEGQEDQDKQACHTLGASKLIEYDLKKTLTACMQDLFGEELQCRWVDAYFPFTHPSFELEIKYKDEWIEMLGCGILRQDILKSAGAGDKIAWAFGLGLERIAMKLFNIPDIRYFWSKEESFLSQFRNCDDFKKIQFKPLISNHPPVTNDISFWLPDQYNSNDFYDLVRGVNSEIVEHVAIVDEFVHPKTDQTSHCYRLFYRHTSRALTQDEVSKVHEHIKNEAVEKLGVKGRW